MYCLNETVVSIAEKDTKFQVEKQFSQFPYSLWTRAGLSAAERNSVEHGGLGDMRLVPGIPGGLL